MTTIQIPICPITQGPIKDPVICPDGHTYERIAIETWLSRRNTSPMNPNKYICLQDIVPNYALRQIIEDNISREHDNQVNENNTTPSLSIGAYNNSAVIFVRSPDLSRRVPRDIVCVIDISGSMCVDALIKTSVGHGEDHGLSILDVVKHAAMTVASSLNQYDRLGIVTFDEKSYIAMELTGMNQYGQSMATENISNICTGGSTNLYAGISKALYMIDTRSNDTSRESSVLVFTDGIPNRRPSRGEDYELKKYKDVNSRCPAVHMFGFSNNLMTELMYDLSIIGNGMFCYIPDASFVGTIFVNALSNILSTYTDNVTLTLGNNNYELGSLQYGQSKSIVFTDKSYDNNEEIVLSYDQNNQRRSVVTSICDIDNDIDIDEIKNALAREYFIQGVKSCISCCVSRQYDDIYNNIRNIDCQLNNISSSPYVESLIQDLNIQISQSLSKDYFNTWGKHFVHSILRAHQLQYCNNFKDPGVQHYGGTLFHELQDSIDNLFNDINPPEPSNRTQESVEVQSMSYYNDSSNPCFAGWSVAELFNGTKCRIDQLVSGDVVKTQDGLSYIVCIVKTYCKDERADLVLLDNGLAVTSYHPIFYDGCWAYPKNVGNVINVSCNAVYSFVLERDHRMLINDIPCVCFGHGFTHDPILDHHYYGTQAVIKDLKNMSGWDTGLIELRSGCIHVNDNGIVERLVYNYNKIIDSVC